MGEFAGERCWVLAEVTRVVICDDQLSETEARTVKAGV